MGVTIRPLDENNLAAANASDASFMVEAELALNAEDGIITYEVRPVAPWRKSYERTDDAELRGFIGNPGKLFYLAFVDGKVAGRASVARNWNGLALIDHVEVDGRFRRRGVGKALIDHAIGWAREKRLPGLMLETQNNNVPACRLYAACGFTLGGFDRYLYVGEMPGTREIALFWYLML